MQQPIKRTIEEQIVEQFRILRQQKGMTQRELSERVGRLGLTVDATAITRIEKGTRSLKLDEAFAMATALDESFAGILRSIEDPSVSIQWMRDQANKYLGEARFSAWQFLSFVQQIRMDLAETPSLMPVSADEYLEWVLGRLAPDRDDTQLLHIYEPDHGRAETMRAMLAALLSDVVVVESEAPDFEEEEGPDVEHQEAT